MKSRGLIINAATGRAAQCPTTTLLRAPNGFSSDVGKQNEGGFVQPKDVFTDFVIQGFLTPAGAGLTGTMSTATWPGGSDAAVAFAGGHRVFKIVGDADLTYPYPANSDTYDDIDASGVIMHSSVGNGAGAPAQPANSLRLQKVVTNAANITSVLQLANTVPKFTKLWTYTAKSANFTADAVDHSYYSVDTSGGIVTATLPVLVAANAGLVLGFKRRGNFKLIISAAALIDGAATVELTVNKAEVDLIYSGSTWEIK